MKLGLYKHYKGRYYIVEHVAKHSETLEDMVVYRALYHSDQFGDNACWIRPLSMFLESIEINGQQVPRFQFCTDKEEFDGE